MQIISNYSNCLNNYNKIYFNNNYLNKKNKFIIENMPIDYNPEFIGIIGDLDPDNFYFIIGKKNEKLSQLINAMEENNITGLFLSHESYSFFEIEKIINNYVNTDLLHLFH